MVKTFQCFSSPELVVLIAMKVGIGDTGQLKFIQMMALGRP